METLAGAWALILWAVLVMIVSVIRRRRCLRDAARPIRRGRQTALVAGALVIAAVAPAVGAWHGRFAFGLLLAGPIFCLVMAAGSLATEVLVRPVAAPRRRATLAARHVLNYVDRPQLIAVCVLFAVAVAFLTTTSFFGSPDDKGRPGRFLNLPDLADPTKGGWSTLWPGAYYSLPLLAALGITLLTTAAALRRIAARPRPVTAGGAADPVAADERARRRSATVVLAAAGVAPAAALCGAGMVAASGMATAGAPWNVLGMLLWVVVAAAAAVGAWSAAVLVTPDRARRPHPAPATA